VKTLLRLACSTGVPAARSGRSWEASADPVPTAERFVGLAVVAVLLLALFA